MEIAFEQRKMILVVFIEKELSLYGTQDFLLFSQAEASRRRFRNSCDYSS
jgi:hypothetical protein